MVVANLVRSGRKQPQRFRHGSSRLPPRRAHCRSQATPKTRKRGRRRGLSVCRASVVPGCPRHRHQYRRARSRRGMGRRELRQARLEQQRHLLHQLPAAGVWYVMRHRSGRTHRRRARRGSPHGQYRGAELRKHTGGHPQLRHPARRQGGEDRCSVDGAIGPGCEPPSVHPSNSPGSCSCQNRNAATEPRAAYTTSQ